MHYIAKKQSVKGAKTLNIGLFTDTYFPQINGVGTSVHTLYQELSAMGHNVYIFTPSDPKRLSDNDENIIRMPSMPCFFLKNFRIGLLYSPKELIKIKELHLDIVHTQTEFSLGTFGKILSKISGIPLVHTYHTMYEDYVHYIVNGALISRSMAHSFSRIFCNSANAVIAPTLKVKNSLLDYGVTRPITIIPTGIDTERFKKEHYTKEDISALRKEYGFDEDTEIMLVLGRIAQEKSIDIIIKSLPFVFSHRKNAKLLVVGDGPYRQTLEDMVNSLGISGKVVFAGAKPWTEIGRYYQMADIYLSASSSETQGLTFVEAMAGGIPVIAKKDQCLDGLIENGVSGIMFDDESTLGELIVSALNDKDKLNEISKNAIASAEKYSSRTFGKNVLALYEQVLEKKEGIYHLPTVAQSANRRLLYMALKGRRRILKTENKIKKTVLRPVKEVREIALKPAKKVKKLYHNIKN